MKLNFLKNLRLSPTTNIGIGSIGMYYLDPHRGAKRRALLVERFIHGKHKTQDLLNKASRDLVNRGQGIVAKAQSFYKPANVSDEVLIARVRSKLGRYVSHPHAIVVHADQGKVTLSGLILEPEIAPLLFRLNRMTEIKEVVNHLETHKKEEHVPSLQGGVPRNGERLDIFQTNWAPGTRVFVGGLGGMITLYGLKRKSFFGSALGFLGLSATFRSMTNLSFRHLLGLGGEKDAIKVQKMINIEAPVERVFQFWSNFENFPKFLTQVREVRVTRGIQSHWSVSGPAGAPISWDAITTKKVENKVLSWKTLPGSVIPNEGTVHFRPNEQGGTRIDLDLAYNPPAGALGHFAAHLFGADPKSKLDNALSQMKTLIEQGPSDRQLRRIAS